MANRYVIPHRTGRDALSVYYVVKTMRVARLHYVSEKRYMIPVFEWGRNTTIERLANKAVFKADGKQLAVALRAKEVDVIWSLCMKHGISFDTTVRKIPEYSAALERDHLQFENCKWRPAVWDAKVWFLRSKYSVLHSLHVAETDPMMVAFAETPAKLLLEKYTITKPGRYLTRFFSDVLDKDTIKELAEEHTEQFSEATLHWAKTKEDMARVVNDGTSDSCMSASFYSSSSNFKWYLGHVHPATIYAAGDIHVAYTLNPKGKITSRCLCNINTMYAARIYGDENKMLPALKKAGFEQRHGALVDCRLLRIESEGSYLMCYVDAGIKSGDGNLYASTSSDGKYWILNDERRGTSTYQGYENKGLVNKYEDNDDDNDEDDSNDVCCSDCNEYTDADNITTVDGDNVCSTCLHNNFTLALSRNCRNRYIPNDDVIYCEGTGEYYHTDYLEANGVGMCDQTGDCYELTDLVTVSDGSYLHRDEAVLIDVEYDGCNYCRKQHVAILPGHRTTDVAATKTCVFTGTVDLRANFVKYGWLSIWLPAFGDLFFRDNFRVTGSSGAWDLTYSTTPHAGYRLDNLPSSFYKNPQFIYINDFMPNFPTIFGRLPHPTYRAYA